MYMRDFIIHINSNDNILLSLPIASDTYLIVPIAIHDGMISNAITPTRAGTFTLRNSSHQESNFEAKKSERENGATSRDWLGLSAVPCWQLFLLYC